MAAVALKGVGVVGSPYFMAMAQHSSARKIDRWIKYIHTRPKMEVTTNIEK